MPAWSGFGAAIDYLSALDRDAALAHEDDVLAYATAQVSAIPGVRIIGEAREKTGVLSFVLDGVHPHDAGTILDQQGIAVRTGQHCAQPVMDRFCIPATIRASLAIYNTREDIDALVRGLQKVREVFGGLRAKPQSQPQVHMSELTDLYQEVILDHNRRPHNFRAIESPSAKQEGYNPLCGDRLTLYLTLDGDVITDVAFQGSGCAISKASASLMTDALKGKTVEQARALFDHFHAMITSNPETPPADLGKLSVFAGVREFPTRIKCASLAWHTMKAAVADEYRRADLNRMMHHLPTQSGGGLPEDSPANALSESTADITPDPAKMDEIAPKVIEALKTVYDPEIPVNIFEMGLIYDVLVDAAGHVGVKMTLTAPACPAAQSLPVEVRDKARSVEGVTDAKVEVVWDPPWTKDRMSDAAKLQLGML